MFSNLKLINIFQGIRGQEREDINRDLNLMAVWIG
jgi:hypothetical protein